MSKTLKDLAEDMRRIDFAMLATHGPEGTIAARPMSNNRQVSYDGDSWFFADENTRMIEEIERDPQVSLTYQGSSGLLGMRPLFIAIEGRASLVRDRRQFTAHWTGDLERWWPQGLSTPGLVLIRVEGERAHYWDGRDEGELMLEDIITLE
ncbi:MAG: pyridoxamine 5'-phosphate oxidase family protein [Sphingobium sp.]|nr:pyridoxamine 5'-phosphate oxidase family protein [Sphingobium sp.]